MALANQSLNDRVVLMLTSGMFDATPGQSILSDFSAMLANGTSWSSVANQLANTTQFKSLYADTLSNDAFATQWLGTMIPGYSASNTADKSVHDSIVSQLNQGVSRGDVILNSLVELSKIPTTDPTWGATAQQWINRSEASSHYSIDLAQSTSSFTTMQQAIAGIDATAATLSAVESRMDQVTSSGTFVLAGKVGDGYLSGATVFIDTNGDGLLSPGEPSTTTDASGNFTLNNAVYGNLVVTGGTDIGTKLPFTGTLNAPSGASVVNPLTTLQAGLVAQGYSTAVAQAKLATALNIDTSQVNLSTYDPFASALNTAATTSNLATAVSTQATIEKLQNLITTGASALVGAAGGTSNLSQAQATAAVLQSIVNAIDSSSTGTVNLNDQTFIQNVLTGSVATANNASLTAAAAKVDSIAPNFSTIVSDSASNIDTLVSKGGDAITTLTQIAQVSAFTQGTAATTIESVANTGSLSSVVNTLTGTAADQSITKTTVGAIDPSNADAVAAAGSVNAAAAAASGGGGGGSSVLSSVTGTESSLWNGTTVVSTIGLGTNVTITGNASIAGLSAIDAAIGTGTLTYTAISDTAAHLVPGGTASLYITDGITVTVSTPATVAQAGAIRTADPTGTLSLSLSDSIANLTGHTTEAGATSYTVLDTAANILGGIAGSVVTGASAVDLSANATGLSVADAASLAALTGFSANGHSLSLSDSIANLTGHTTEAGATSYTVLDTATNILGGISGSVVTGASAVDLSANATDLSFADAASLAGITGFSLNGHTYSIADTAATIAANASSPVVTGASAVNLSADALGLSVAQATALAAIAGFSVNGHALTLSDSIANLTGHTTEAGATSYTVLDTATNILDPGASTLDSGATTINVTGSVTGANLDTLAGEAYATKVNLSSASISGVLTVSQATFAHDQSGTYATITDSLAAITGGSSTVVNAATTVNVTGSVTGANLDTLAGETYATKVNLSGSSISGALTVSEAAYANTHSGTYATITDSLAAITGGSSTVVNAATTVNVTGSVTGANLDTLAGETYATKVNLSSASISGTLTVVEATYAHAHSGTYASITDSLANLTSADSAVISAATSYTLTDASGSLGTITSAQAVLVGNATDATNYTYITSISTGTLTLNNCAGDTLNISGGNITFGNANGNNILNISGTSTMSLGTHTSGDTLNITGGTSAAIIISGETASDSIAISGGTSNTLTLAAANATPISVSGGTTTLSEAGAGTLTNAISVSGGSLTLGNYEYGFAATGATLTLSGNGTVDLGVTGGNIHASADTVTVSGGTPTLSDLGGSDVLAISGGTLTATLGANWTATASTSNAGTATISTAGHNISLASATGTNGWTLTATGTGTTTMTGSAQNDTLNGNSAGGITIDGHGGTDTIALGTHTMADTIYVSGTTNAIETVTGFGSSTGTVADILNVTATGNVLAGVTLIDETSLAFNKAALGAASGYVFHDADGGTALTATTAAALFSTTKGGGHWAITAGAGTQTELLIETGATTTSDTVWKISETSGGVFTAVKVVGVTVVATHDVVYSTLA